MLPMKKTKIDLALGASWQLISSFLREGVDRAMIASFGNTPFQVEQDFTDKKSQLRSALEAVGRSVTNEGTRLYDAIAAGVDAFWAAGRRQAAWLFITVTDGEDKGSVKFAETSLLGRRLSPEAMV